MLLAAVSLVLFTGVVVWGALAFLRRLVTECERAEREEADLLRLGTVDSYKQARGDRE